MRRLSTVIAFSFLFFTLPALLLEQSAQAKSIHATGQQNTLAVAAIGKAQKANVRNAPAKFAGIVATVNEGDLLSLIRATPIGPWYQVRDRRTNYEGWIHGNTVALLQTTDRADASSTQTQQPLTTLPRVSGKSYVNVDGTRVPSLCLGIMKPAGATARCRDGSYSFSQHRRGTGSHHGGVAMRF